MKLMCYIKNLAGLYSQPNGVEYASVSLDKAIYGLQANHEQFFHERFVGFHVCL